MPSPQVITDGPLPPNDGTDRRPAIRRALAALRRLPDMSVLVDEHYAAEQRDFDEFVLAGRRLTAWDHEAAIDFHCRLRDHLDGLVRVCGSVDDLRVVKVYNRARNLVEAFGFCYDFEAWWTPAELAELAEKARAHPGPEPTPSDGGQLQGPHHLHLVDG